MTMQSSSSGGTATLSPRRGEVYVLALDNDQDKGQDKLPQDKRQDNRTRLSRQPPDQGLWGRTRAGQNVLAQQDRTRGTTRFPSVPWRVKI